MTDFRLLRGLSQAQLDQLASVLRPREVAPGEYVVREGEEADELYLVDEGELEVLKSGQQVARFGPGDTFGAMALLESQERTATIRALTPVRLRALSVADLRGLEGAAQMSTVALMIRNQLDSHMHYLRTTTEKTVEALRRELAETRARVSLGSFLTFLVGLMCLYGYFLRGSVVLIARLGDSTPVTATLLVVYAGALLIMVQRSGYPLRSYGLTLENWRGSLLESLVWTAAFLAVLTFLKWLALLFVPAYAGQPLFSMRGFVKYTPLVSLGIAAAYSVLAPAQEFIARGALQSSFQQFLGGRWVTAKAIVLSTLLFGTTHLHMSIGYAVVAIVPSIFWGILYARQRTLVGVSVSHVAIGLYVAFFLGFPGVATSQ